jgi:hypothetical protein
MSSAQPGVRRHAQERPLDEEPLGEQLRLDVADVAAVGERPGMQ